MTHTLYFTCAHCHGPNPAPSVGGHFICHHCDLPTPGPRSDRSQRLLSPRGAQTCPYFCDESQSRSDRLCQHTSDELAALREPTSFMTLVPLVALSAASAVGTFAFLLQL